MLIYSAQATICGTILGVGKGREKWCNYNAISKTKINIKYNKLLILLKIIKGCVLEYTLWQNTEEDEVF